MPLIIDCYNLLHATMPEALAGLDTTGLCRLLGRPAARRILNRRRFVVVCDGAPGPGRPAASPVEHVELVYAGHRRSADDVIVERIDGCSAPRRLTVVSGDRAIRRAARRRRSEVIDSDRFVGRLLAIVAAPARGGTASASPKPGDAPLSPDQVARWARAFGLDPEADRP